MVGWKMKAMEHEAPGATVLPLHWSVPWATKKLLSGGVIEMMFQSPLPTFVNVIVSGALDVSQTVSG
jgi:hypothetical protein